MKIRFKDIIVGAGIALICFIAGSRMTVDSFVSGATSGRSEVLLAEIHQLVALKQMLDTDKIESAHTQVANSIAAKMNELKGYRTYASEPRKKEIDDLFIGLAQYRNTLTSENSSNMGRRSWNRGELDQLIQPAEELLRLRAEQAEKQAHQTAP